MDDVIRCAELCVESYAPWPSDGFRDVEDLRYGVVRDKGQTYLVFRGTANVPNGIRDIMVFPVRSRGGYRVHHGFATGVERLYRSVCGAVPIRERAGLIVTGHSFGAAVALLFAEVFGCRVITFGCPRVYFRWGGAPEADHLRIVCDDDPVPMVPRLLYRHVCEPLVLEDTDGGIDVGDHGVAVYQQRLQQRFVPAVA